MDSSKLAVDALIPFKVVVSHLDILQVMQLLLWAGSFSQSFTGANTLFIRLLQMP